MSEIEHNNVKMPDGKSVEFAFKKFKLKSGEEFSVRQASGRERLSAQIEWMKRLKDEDELSAGSRAEMLAVSVDTILPLVLPKNVSLYSLDNDTLMAVHNWVMGDEEGGAAPLEQ